MQLVVLGMHRSGTSSVTGLLSKAGAYFGPDEFATETNDENPKGFWERRDVREVCDALLASAGATWWRVADFALEAIPSGVRDEQLARFSEIVRELDTRPPWVIKEPRLCLLLPLLLPALDSPVCVHVAREPLEIAASLAARNDFPEPAGIALWELYSACAYTASAGLPRVLVRYADLVAAPVATTNALLAQLASLGVDGLHQPADADVSAFVSSALHRQHRYRHDRESRLNARQLLLAHAEDTRAVLDEQPPELSDGARQTLRWFEADRDRQASTAATEASEQNRRTRQAAALLAAERRTRALEASGALRLANRLSGLRRPFAGGGDDTGVNAAVAHIADDLVELRNDLGDSTAASGSASADEPAGPTVAELPPPLEVQKAARATARANGERPKVAVLAWDVGHNPLGRAYLLAELLEPAFEVEVWGAQFDRYGAGVWPPLRNSRIPIHSFTGRAFPSHLETMYEVSRRIDADAIVVSKPRLPSFMLGALAKQRWNRPLVLDVDDFEPAFFAQDGGIDVSDVLASRTALHDHDLKLPFGRIWTQVCETVIGAADRVTVSNVELQARYGGTIVPHARDERLFDPSKYDRGRVRDALGFGDDDRVLFLGGTPRAHKGLNELLDALERLDDPRYRVMVFGTREFEQLKGALGRKQRWVTALPYQPFDELPGLVAAADLACVLQTPSHPVARYQMPAKVTDAMAMGVPCLVTPVPPLRPLIDKDVVNVHTGEMPLEDRLRAVFDDEQATKGRAAAARDVFLDSYTFEAVRPLLTAAVAGILDDPPAMPSALGAVVDAPPAAFPWMSFSVAEPRAPVRVTGTATKPRPAGQKYDLVLFWKQNDTGIYGRRQDMFRKYLELSGRFEHIVHFDQPTSPEALLKTLRKSRGSHDQSGLVLRQTVRRLLHRADTDAITSRTFVYGAKGITRRLGFPRRTESADFVRKVLAAEDVGTGARPVVFWAYPTLDDFPAVADALGPDIVVADVVDDNRLWYSPDNPYFAARQRNYRDVLARSDVVIANCEPVADAMAAFAPEVHVVPNACEPPSAIPTYPRPSELDGLNGPVIGYCGNLSDRVDIDLLDEVVRARPDWSFVFVGSAHLDRSALRLQDQPNAHFVGPKPHDEALAFMQYFDVALIPHVHNEMTRSMNPLKAYVYVAVGIPIVATPVSNLDELAEFITVAATPPTFVDAIDKALREGRRLPTDESLRGRTWPDRVAGVLELIDQVPVRAETT
jgi:glycosyltransferase involved in cell wall biosynthesis